MNLVHLLTLDGTLKEYLWILEEN